MARRRLACAGKDLSMIEALTFDLRYAFRIWVRRPFFLGAVVLILGLTIGTATSVFSIVDSVVFRQLPFADPERLVAVGLSLPTRKKVSSAALSSWITSGPRPSRWRRSLVGPVTCRVAEIRNGCKESGSTAAFQRRRTCL